MSELIAQVAAALGVPESLIERSAAARAAESGSSAEEVLAAWAGGGAVASAAPPVDAAPEVAETTTEVEAPEPVAAPAAVIEAVPAAPQPIATTLAPLPSEVTAAEAANLPEVITVPTAGIRERTNFRIPKWLVAVFLIIPLFALFALGGSATGACGESTELETDVVSGAIVNCDGSEFTGSGIGGGGTDYIALGERIYNGEEGGANCAGCHGAGGGGGVGPALNGVLTVFGSCADHEEWIALATPGFQAAGISTYGDTNKPVGGGGTMPGFGALSEEQLAAVTAFERVRFGGGDVDETLSDCGLAEDTEPAEGEDGGGAPAEDAPAEENAEASAAVTG
jgi:mono/diheme cytochrome c family protein